MAFLFHSGHVCCSLVLWIADFLATEEFMNGCERKRAGSHSASGSVHDS